MIVFIGLIIFFCVITGIITWDLGYKDGFSQGYNQGYNFGKEFIFKNIKSKYDLKPEDKGD